MTHCEKKAYAKINLSLDVTARRADGYHDLKSVMQRVSLCDVLTFTRRENGFSMASDGTLPCDERNLVFRAAKAYFAAAGHEFGVHVDLEKHIPMQAGLGGGSADAAATLCALNEMDGARFDVQTLCEIGATIGADVPFCVCGGTAVCQGIGERITPVVSALQAHVVIAMRGEGVSTPWAFAKLDEKYDTYAFASNEADARLARVVKALERGDISALDGAAYNRFEDVIEQTRPDVALLKQALALMSGSGPAVFGLFATESAANSARDTLLEMGAVAYCCEVK